MAQSMGESSKMNGNLSNEEVYKVDTVNERLEKPKNDDSKMNTAAITQLHDEDDQDNFDNEANPKFRRQPPKRLPSVAGSHYGRTERPFSYMRNTSYQPSVGGQSHHSQHSGHSQEHLIPPPSTEAEKWKMTRRYFATVFALSYAIFLVVGAAAAFVGDAVSERYPLAESFLIYMISIGIIYFVWLYIDIRLHVSKAKKAVLERERRMEQYEEQMAKNAEMANGGGPMELRGNGHANGHIQTWAMEPAIEPISHKYCFATGRHGELFYLKLGAAWFCFGLLIHSILHLSYQIIFLVSTDPKYTDCQSVVTLFVEILTPLYSIFLLFFIFKYANLIINEYRGVARLLLMHAIGTSLGIWIYTIVRETADAIAIKNAKKYGSSDDGFEETDATLHDASSYVAWFTKGRNVIDESEGCPGPEDLNVIYRNFSPYLYPFVIEFNILIVGIFYIIYMNINKCPKKLSASGHGHDAHGHHDSHAHISTTNSTQELVKDGHGKGHQTHDNSDTVSEHCGNTTSDHDTQYKSTLVIYADCHASSRGLFAGLLLVVLTLVFIILFHVAANEGGRYLDIGITMNNTFQVSVLGVMTLAVIAAYYQTSKMDINTHPISKLDDFLLFIAIPAFFSETIFSLVPALDNGSAFNICIIFCQLIQIMIQTPWIIDAMRRCCNAKELRRDKPGRELVTFLTIANVSLWLFYTFSVKNADIRDERYYYYGDTLWSILNHVSLPLIMFYRFHASVCLVDVWRHAYEPGGGH